MKLSTIYQRKSDIAARSAGHLWLVALVGGCLLGTALINFYVLPQNSLVSSLYAIPILIAAHRLSSNGVAVVALLAVLLYLASGYLDQPVVSLPYGAVGIILIGYLAVALSRERSAALARAHEAEQARAQLQQFLSMVLHDLGQPLTAVVGYAHMLSRSDDRTWSQRDARSLAAMRNAMGRMERLIADLRDAARVGTGHFAVVPRPLELVEVSRRVVDEQQATSPMHRIVLDAPERVDVEWDGVRTGQLLTNLVSNAIRYSPEGGEITVSVRPTAAEVSIAVSDEGIGIAPDQQDLLFRPFSRLEPALSTEGTGLGLYISRAIVEAHSGRLKVESVPGHGSTFRAIIPIRGPGSPRVDDEACAPPIAGLRDFRSHRPGGVRAERQ